MASLPGAPVAQRWHPNSTDFHAERQRSKAHACWRRSVPIAGTPAERYLRSRKYSGPLPATLRYLPPHKREHHPAMIAAFGVPNELEPGALQIEDEQITEFILRLSHRTDAPKPALVATSS